MLIPNIQAQVIITKASNDPSVGDTFNTYDIVGTVDNSSSGNNAIFNNANLRQGSLATVRYYMPSGSEISTFPGSNLKMTDDVSTAFYKSSATKLEITGITSSGATLNFSADNGTIITYPASFGYAETDNARGIFSSSSGSGLFKGTISNTADAAGTLIVGTKIYTDVLRIKSTQNFNLYQSTDTNYLFSIGTITNTSFLYYDSLHKFPLLSSTNGNLNIPLLSINHSTSQAKVLDEVFLSDHDFGKDKAVLIAPNPATDYIKIIGKQVVSHSIYNLNSQLIFTSKNTDNIVDVRKLKRDAYILEINFKDNKTLKVKFVKM